ncbi:MAG: hypothetical protein PHQ23_10270 [Candidatus Wallbacteria bacterium]|nr:hypothetical protein [Candidatus Wallbacteria bacterium]
MKKICAALSLSLLFSGLSAEPKLVTLNEQNTPLPMVLEKIGLNVTGLSEIYPDEGSMPRVTAVVENLPDSQALKAVCATLNLEAVKSGDGYVVRRSKSQPIAAFGNDNQNTRLRKSTTTGDADMEVYSELKMKQMGISNETFYREFNRQITITKAIPGEKRIEIMFQGEPFSVVEGENFMDRIQLLRVLNNHEALIYYPQMLVRLTARVQEEKVSSSQNPKTRAYSFKAASASDKNQIE